MIGHIARNKASDKVVSWSTRRTYILEMVPSYTGADKGLLQNCRMWKATQCHISYPEICRLAYAQSLIKDVAKTLCTPVAHAKPWRNHILLIFHSATWIAYHHTFDDVARGELCQILLCFSILMTPVPLVIYLRVGGQKIALTRLPAKKQMLQ